MSNYKDHAIREFQAAGWVDKDGKWNDESQKMICEQVMELLELFGTHGHSGSSAPYAINLFKKLANFEPITPLTGEDSEWVKVGDGLFQNNRCSHVFKENGEAYDIQGVVFYDTVKREDGSEYKDYFTNYNSRVKVIFPYIPKTEYKNSRITEYPKIRKKHYAFKISIQDDIDVGHSWYFDSDGSLCIDDIREAIETFLNTKGRFYKIEKKNNKYLTFS